MLGLKSALVAAAMIVNCGTAKAAPVLRLTLTGQLSQQYNYVTGAYETLTVPRTVTVTATTPLDGYSTTDYGMTTIVQYPFGKTIISDPLIGYVGTDHVGNGLTDLGKSAYSFADTNDSASTFITEFAFQDNIFHSVAGHDWTYHTEIRIDNRGQSRGGTGLADYALTPALLIPYLTSELGQPIAYYNTSWSEYTENPAGGVTYSAGKNWSSYAMTFTSFDVISAVPETSTWAMMVIGFGAVGIAMRRRRQPNMTIRFV